MDTYAIRLQNLHILCQRIIECRQIIPHIIIMPSNIWGRFHLKFQPYTYWLKGGSELDQNIASI